MYWFLDKNIADAITQAEASGLTPSAAQADQFVAFMGAENDPERTPGYSVRNGVAQIDVKGVLTETPSFYAMLFGGGNTTYTRLRKNIAMAEADPSVERVQYNIDSPGGAVNGLFETLDAMTAGRKPSETIARQATSAAYALASKTGAIKASSVGSMFGSIGVAVQGRVGGGVKEIASRLAPKKRPDLNTDEGVAMVQDSLDEIHSVFVNAIAAGRGTTADKVNKSFGEGATLLAEDALKRGMIDSIGVNSPESGMTASLENTVVVAESLEADPMDLQKLRADHPTVFAEAVQIGVNQERDRVTAHAKMGKATGAVDTAFDAIVAGDSMTDSIRADYDIAAMNKRAKVEGAASDATAADALSGAADAESADADAEWIAAQMAGDKE